MVYGFGGYAVLNFTIFFFQAPTAAPAQILRQWCGAGSQRERKAGEQIFFMIASALVVFP